MLATEWLRLWDAIDEADLEAVDEIEEQQIQEIRVSYPKNLGKMEKEQKLDEEVQSEKENKIAKVVAAGVGCDKVGVKVSWLEKGTILVEEKMVDRNQKRKVTETEEGKKDEGFGGEEEGKEEDVGNVEDKTNGGKRVILAPVTEALLMEISEAAVNVALSKVSHSSNLEKMTEKYGVDKEVQMGEGNKTDKRQLAVAKGQKRQRAIFKTVGQEENWCQVARVFQLEEKMELGQSFGVPNPELTSQPTFIHIIQLIITQNVLSQHTSPTTSRPTPKPPWLQPLHFTTTKHTSCPNYNTHHKSVQPS